MLLSADASLEKHKARCSLTGMPSSGRFVLLNWGTFGLVDKTLSCYGDLIRVGMLLHICQRALLSRSNLSWGMLGPKLSPVTHGFAFAMSCARTKDHAPYCQLMIDSRILFMANPFLRDLLLPNHRQNHEALKSNARFCISHYQQRLVNKSEHCKHRDMQLPGQHDQT